MSGILQRLNNKKFEKKINRDFFLGGGGNYVKIFEIYLRKKCKDLQRFELENTAQGHSRTLKITLASA